MLRDEPGAVSDGVRLPRVGDLMIRIDAPHFVGGVILDADGRVVRAAPILGWTVGKSADEVRAYCKRRGWIVEDIEG